jgi:hypothetical protein
MIIGKDLLQSLVINLLFYKAEITWDNDKSMCNLQKFSKKPVKTIKWSTKAGSYKTKRSCDIEFTLPGFHEHRKINCTAYVDESNHNICNYDMIIGRYILHSLGINLLFDTAEISGDNARIKMQTQKCLKTTG